MRLSGHEHNYDDVRGQGFLAQARRERRAYPRAVCEERTTKPAPKRPAALRVAPNLACGFVARRLQPAAGMRPPRASPQAKLGATNVIVFMFMTTKARRISGLWRGASEAHTRSGLKRASNEARGPKDKRIGLILKAIWN